MCYKIVLIFFISYVIRQNVASKNKCSSWSNDTEDLNEDLFQLTVIHINDFHARFEETAPNSGICKKPSKCIGGISRLYTELNSHIDRPNVIYLNAGDSFQGTLWYNLYGWNVTQYFLNKLPVDAYTLGNHEFDGNIDDIVPFIKALDKPVVVSNIDDSLETTMKNIYKKSTVLIRNGKRIGIIGVMTNITNILSNAGKVKFLDATESINKEAKNLDDCDIIIVLSHCGLQEDLKIATKLSPKINLIVGGHSHTLLYNGPAPGVEQPEGPYPVVVERDNGRKVLIVQASAFTKYVGNLTVFYDKEGNIVNWDGQPIYMSHDKPKDKKINKIIDIWKVEPDKYDKYILGRTNVLLNKEKCQQAECNIGDFFTDAMVDYYKEIAEPNTWTYASIGLVNSGALRVSILPGIITHRDLTTVFPFKDTIDVGELTGEEIKQSLEYSVTRIARRTNFWHFLQVSGLRFTADFSKPKGSRIIDLKILCQKCMKPKFENYQPKALYRIALTSFLRKGGDGHKIIMKKLRNLKIGISTWEVVKNYIQKMTPITISNDGRINMINMNNLPKIENLRKSRQEEPL